MIWLILALVMAFAVIQSLVIERLWRDQRRTRGELDEVYQQVDALSVAVDRQVLTQEQIHDQIKPVAAAIRESNQMVVETMDSLVDTVRAAKAERRQLRDLIDKAAGSRASGAVEIAEQAAVEPGAPPAVEIGQPAEEPSAPLSWPDTNGRLDITAVARKSGRSRSEVALAQRLGRTVAQKKRALG
jgi:hypothetical protein